MGFSKYLAASSPILLETSLGLSLNTITQVDLDYLHMVLQLSLLSSAMSTLSSFSDSFEVAHSTMENFFFTPSNSQYLSTFLVPTGQNLIEGQVLSFTCDSRDSASVILILATYILPLKCVETASHSLLSQMQTEQLASQKLIRQGSLSLKKVVSQLFTSRTIVFDFCLSCCQSSHYFFALSASFSINYLFALASLATLDLAWITALVLLKTNATILSTVNSPSYSTTWPSSPYSRSLPSSTGSSPTLKNPVKTSLTCSRTSASTPVLSAINLSVPVEPQTTHILEEERIQSSC